MIESKICFMSNKEAQSLEIRQVMTINLNNRPYEYAKTLNERKLLATLSAGDVIAQEHKYHIFCLPGLYNRKRRYLIATRRLEQDMHSMKIPAHRHSQSYLHILWRLSDLKRVLQSSDLQIYFTCMPNTWNSCTLMHPLSTPQDLGKKLLLEIPEVEAHKQGRYIYWLSTKMWALTC